MSYRILSYEVLQANLSTAGTTLVLCRPNIGRIGCRKKRKQTRFGASSARWLS